MKYIEKTQTLHFKLHISDSPVHTTAQNVTTVKDIIVHVSMIEDIYHKSFTVASTYM